MKSKWVALGIGMTMTAVAVVGGTLAYFTAKDEATNVITMGNVDITLDEAQVVQNADGSFLATGERVKENSYTSVYPGESLPKDPTITNKGSMDAYVRVTVGLDQENLPALLFKDAFAAGMSLPGAANETLLAQVFGGYDPSQWDVTVKYGGAKPVSLVFTRIERLKSGEKAVLFETVNMSEKITCEDLKLLQDNTFCLHLTAEAVQAVGFNSAAEAFVESFDAE